MRYAMKVKTMLLAVSLGASIGAGVEAKSSEQFNWSGQIAAGKSIEIKGINGKIEALPATGQSVEVEASKTARRDDPSEVEIKVIERKDGVTICALYPTPSLSRPNECAPGEGGRMNTRDNDVDVDFVVRVPKGVHFIGRTVNGRIEATELQADIDVSSVNGNVRAYGTGTTRAETVNGSVSAAMGRTDWAGELTLKTVNGTVSVDLPADASADVHAETVNGGITSDFPITVKGKWGPKHANGTLGSGGRQLNLETVNGAIRIRKR